MKTIKIFLASSDELRQERLELADFVEHLNHTFEKLDIHVQLEKWEYLDASMGTRHKQEDYNDVLRECEICMVLYWTKFGLYTKSELDTAYNELKAGHNPKKLYVYFKDTEGDEQITEELKAFRESFQKEYGHFETRFRNIDTLKSHFLLQFIDYKSKELKNTPLIEVRDGKVSMGGKTYIDLKNVPFVGNNDEYNSILDKIEDLEEWLGEHEPDHKRYAEKAKQLREFLEKKEKMESSLWGTALDITRMSNQKCSERLQRAIDLFNEGNNKGANAILNEEEICRDAEQNIHLIELGEEGRKGLITNIEELKLKIKTLENEMSEGWGEEILKLQEKVIEYTKKAFGENSEEYINALLKGGDLYGIWRMPKKSLPLQEKALELCKKLFGEDNEITVICINDVGVAYQNQGNFKKGIEYTKRALLMRMRLLGLKHPATADSFNNVGGGYLEAKDYEKALHYLQISLKIRMKILDEAHIDTAITLYNIGSAYYGLKDWHKSLEFRRKALNSLLSNLGVNHPYIAFAYNNLGASYRKLGDHQQALEYRLQSLNVMLRLFGQFDSKTSTVFKNVGLSYSDLGDYDKALEYIGKAYVISKEIGRTEEEAIHLNRLGRVYALMEDKETAKAKFREAIRLLPEDHPDAIDSKERLNAILNEVK